MNKLQTLVLQWVRRVRDFLVERDINSEVVELTPLRTELHEAISQLRAEGALVASCGSLENLPATRGRLLRHSRLPRSSAAAAASSSLKRLPSGEQTDADQPAEEGAARRREAARADLRDERPRDGDVLAAPFHFTPVTLLYPIDGDHHGRTAIGNHAADERFRTRTDYRRENHGTGVAQPELRLTTSERSAADRCHVSVTARYSSEAHGGDRREPAPDLLH